MKDLDRRRRGFTELLPVNRQDFPEAELVGDLEETLGIHDLAQYTPR